MDDIFTADIGGAFIKTSFLPSGGGPPKRNITPFRMWEQPEKLPSVLKSLKTKTKKVKIAITMTGELCDCFRNRAQGVRHIVRSAQKAFGPNITVFGRKGILFPPRGAERSWEETASANWAITPLYLGRIAPDFLLVDIGSTTTDFTPVRNGKIANIGWNDFERLENGELLYTGYLRTPVQAVAQSLNIRGKNVPLSSANFSIMGDVYLILGAITFAKYNVASPDGGRKTRAAAFTRLARTILSSRREIGDAELTKMAEQAARTQKQAVIKAAKRFRLRIIAVGSGSFILKEALMTGDLKPHELHGSAIGKLDPSLSLALLLKNRLSATCSGRQPSHA